MSKIVIAGAARTPIGSFNGALKRLSASELGAIAIKEALQRAATEADEVNEVVLGQILQAGAGQGPARQAAMAAGVPKEATAYSLNQLCGSGLRAVAEGYKSLLVGDCDIVVAGGQESMSQAPHAVQMRDGVKMGPASLVDTMVHDALWDAFNNVHMGATIDALTAKYGITRADQDAFATASQNKCEQAQKAGKFEDEIVPVTIRERKGDVVVDRDEYPRAGVTMETLSRLRPAFNKEGTVTAGNASGINDGAAAVVLMRDELAQAKGIEPLAEIKSWATVGVDPMEMGVGPIYATRKALKKAGWTLDDVDLIESNEAFAGQSLVVGKELDWNPEIVNVNGGAIALGHPVGASGCRVLITLLYEMQKRDVKKGLVTLCIGGGMGIAMCVERP